MDTDHSQDFANMTIIRFNCKNPKVELSWRIGSLARKGRLLVNLALFHMYIQSYCVLGIVSLLHPWYLFGIYLVIWCYCTEEWLRINKKRRASAVLIVFMCLFDIFTCISDYVHYIFTFKSCTFHFQHEICHSEPQ